MLFRKSLVFIFAAGALIALAAGAPQTRIVNGDDAAEGQFPYQAQLFIAGTPTCGATVLSENFVLTLATCVCYHNTDVPPFLSVGSLILAMASKISQLIVILSLWCVAASATPTQRVVGGENAAIGQFPYQVVLFKDNQFTCGGSIISSRYVLTAAHCVVAGDGIASLPARYFTVRVGSIQRLAGGKIVAVNNVIVRSTYGNFLDDVALLELSEELQFTNNIQKIDLFSGDVPSGEPVVVSGWGRTYHGGPVANQLQYNTLTALDNHECDEAINWGYEQIICLAHPRDNGVCNGDSGGPATYQGKLVGVAGFVVGGCGNIYPDGYAKVSYHREWILANMV